MTGIKFISYVETHVINLEECTWEQWNHFVINVWREELAHELPVTKANWDKAERRIIDNLPPLSSRILINNPNGII